MRSAEKIKKLIKNLNLDVETNSEADQRVLDEILHAKEKSRKTEPVSASTTIRSQEMTDKSRAWKVAAAIALICMGGTAAAVVGARIYKWHVESKHPELGYILRSEDGNNFTNIPETWADSPAQAVEVKEELDIQEQQNNRKLVSVSERTLNGLLQRSLTYEHTLSNGRVVKTNEADPEAPRFLTREQREEIRELWHERLREEGGDGGATLEERQVKGQTFSFTTWRFTLSDGSDAVYSIGRLKEE